MGIMKHKKSSELSPFKIHMIFIISIKKILNHYKHSKIIIKIIIILININIKVFIVMIPILSYLETMLNIIYINKIHLQVIC